MSTTFDESDAAALVMAQFVVDLLKSGAKDFTCSASVAEFQHAVRKRLALLDELGPADPDEIAAMEELAADLAAFGRDRQRQVEARA